MDDVKYRATQSVRHFWGKTSNRSRMHIYQVIISLKKLLAKIKAASISYFKIGSYSVIS